MCHQYRYLRTDRQQNGQDSCVSDSRTDGGWVWVLLKPFITNRQTDCWTNLLIAKSRIFWVVTPCSSEKIRHFGRTYGLHLQGRTVSQGRSQQKQTSSCWFHT
jgi:hypothetical protein